MTNGEMIQKVFNCEVCEPIIEDDVIHAIFADKKDSAIGFDWSWWNAEYKESTKSKYEDGALYFDCKDGVYGINTSSDRKGRFFPFPYFLSNGEIDWKKFKRHYNNVYEYVGEIIEAERKVEE